MKKHCAHIFSSKQAARYVSDDQLNGANKNATPLTTTASCIQPNHMWRRRIEINGVQSAICARCNRIFGTVRRYLRFRTPHSTTHFRGVERLDERRKRLPNRRARLAGATPPGCATNRIATGWPSSACTNAPTLIVVDIIVLKLFAA